MNNAVETRIALVIGAGSGMGSAVASQLYKDGYQLILADISTDSLSQLSTKLNAQTFSIDISSDQAVRELVSKCTSGIDALVITAGLSASMASFERIIDVNLSGSARVLREFTPVIKKGGVAVCFASMAAYLAGPLEPQIEEILCDTEATALGDKLFQALPEEMRAPGMAYTLSKVGVMKLVERMSITWGAQEARVCSISPGCIDTPMGTLERNAAPAANKAVTLAPIPRLGTSEELADVVSFLCSTKASYITGCDILVDGGWVGALHSGTEDSPFAKALADGRETN